MSRELLERLSKYDNSTDSSSAYGAPASHRRVVRKTTTRRWVRQYTDSHLGSGGDPVRVRRPGGEIYSAKKDMENRERLSDPIGEGSPSGPSSERINTNQNRPSAGFKEPPGRRFDPFCR